MLAFFSCGGKKTKAKKIKHHGLQNTLKLNRPLPPDQEMLPKRPITVQFDFNVSTEGTVAVGKGSKVIQLHAVNGWLYVRTSDGKEGYIPASYCSRSTSSSSSVRERRLEGDNRPSPSRPVKPRHLPKAASLSSGIGLSQNGDSIKGASPPAESLRGNTGKKALGVATAVFDFLAENCNEASMLRGDKVTVLSEDDPDWYWVRTEDKAEGFVPRTYVYWAGKSQETCECCRQTHEFTISPVADQQFWYMEDDESSSSSSSCTDDDVDSPDSVSDPIELDVDEARCHPAVGRPAALVELRAVKDYKRDGRAYLSIKVGDRLFADATDRRNDGWLRAYSSRTERHGLIPALYAEPTPKSLSTSTSTQKNRMETLV
eukprot:m.17097 g.17097  ORF g.17097 m.17097 type:complete len:373 (+) comp27319_c0_seq2:619-1737(+)